MKTIEIREKFIEFFEGKNHKYYESAPLIPNDPTLLFTVAGMIPFKPFFLGTKLVENKRAVSCQRCIRTNDIENIGITKRHFSFFEMLGNFSFGDYFKEDAIKFAWEFITEVLKLDEEKLVVTIYENDDEAFNIWNEKVGVKKSRIKRLGKEHNFWESGLTGPCGPCSEIYYCYEDPEKFDQDSENYFEFWNLVFMQYNKKEDGSLEELPNKNIDTGMGLERIARLLQNKDSNFEIDNIYPIIQEIEELSKLKYQQNIKAFRVITDHLRSSVFLILDGVLPSNEKRGYVLRRLIRRACRYGLKLDLKDSFLFKLVDKVIEIMSPVYKELLAAKEYIKDVIKSEEEKFDIVLSKGLEFLKEEIAKSAKKLSSKIAFKLYDTYGFPFELTKELCEEENIEVSEDEFNKLLEEHQNLSRNSRTVEKLEIADDKINEIYKEYGATNFLGYIKLEEKARILEIFSGNEIILDKTVFYAESGGQVADYGIIENEKFLAEVIDVQKVKEIFIHKINIKKGFLSKGDVVVLKVDNEKREATKRNHSAVHLLHASLKKVLGENVKQAGSLVNHEIGRLDFSYSSSLTNDQILHIENIINDEILKNHEVITHIKNVDEATKMGAVALFEEKYGNVVRVIQMSNFSLEFCGGTHVSRTGDIGIFKIISEKSIGSNIRRIELITGKNVKKYLDRLENTLFDINNLLKVSEDKIINKIENLLEENSLLKTELGKFKKDILQQEILKNLEKAEEVKGIKILITDINENVESLKKVFDIINSKNVKAISLINFDNKGIGILVNNLNIDANGILKKCFEIAKGKGGGKANMAQGKIENSFQNFSRIFKDIVLKEINI